MKKKTNPLPQDTAPVTPSAPPAVVIDKMKDKFQLAGDELQRMEDEGGPPMEPQQAEKADTFIKVATEIKRVSRVAKKRPNINIIAFFVHLQNFLQQEKQAAENSTFTGSLRHWFRSAWKSITKAHKTNPRLTNRK